MTRPSRTHGRRRARGYGWRDTRAAGGLSKPIVHPRLRDLAARRVQVQPRPHVADSHQLEGTDIDGRLRSVASTPLTPPAQAHRPPSRTSTPEGPAAGLSGLDLHIRQSADIADPRSAVMTRDVASALTHSQGWRFRATVTRPSHGRHTRSIAIANAETTAAFSARGIPPAYSSWPLLSFQSARLDHAAVRASARYSLIAPRGTLATSAAVASSRAASSNVRLDPAHLHRSVSWRAPTTAARAARRSFA